MALTSTFDNVWFVIDPTDDEVLWLANQPMIFDDLNKNRQLWCGQPCVFSNYLTEQDVVILTLKFGDRLTFVPKDTTMGQYVMGNPRF